MGFSGGLVLKIPPASAGDTGDAVSIPWDNPWEEEMVTHTIFLDWRISWTGESGGQHSVGSHRVGHD